MQAVSVKSSSKRKSQTPRILVVDDERDLHELAGLSLRSQLDARVETASTQAQARDLINSQTFDVVVLDINLPDGPGMDLIDQVRAKLPQAGVIVVSGAASVDLSVRAFRLGALDFLPKPFDADTLVQRVEAAIRFQQGIQRTETRLKRLRSAVRRLNNARRMVSKKVDLLCNDLVGAYGDLARQLEEVRVRESFRKTITESKDLEQMLCHTMDWLLRSTGYTNIAVYLSGDDQTFELGAYMKYTIAGSKPMTDALRKGLLEHVLREEFVHWTDREAHQLLTDAELDHLAGCSVMGINCTYLGESLATILMFRDGKSPFTTEDVAALRAVAPVFAHGLTNIARRGEPGDEPDGNDESGWPDEDGKKPGAKKDDADWWKRGEAPPF
jgi:DNA-binding response OmpR family regulator